MFCYHVARNLFRGLGKPLKNLKVVSKVKTRCGDKLDELEICSIRRLPRKWI